MRPWAAARPRDRHTRACGSEWSISKPGQAPPPPTGAAARPSGPSGALHTCGAGALIGASSRSPAMPHHRPPAPRQIPPAPSTPVGPGRCFLVRCVVSMPGQIPPPPTGTAADPSGALHTCGAGALIGASSRSPARPRRCPRAPQPGPPVPPGPSNPSNRPVLGRESPKTQTTSVKMREFGVFWARWSAFWAHGGYE